MKLQKIYLKNYRNYDDILLELNNNLNIIIGDNAQGKTNLNIKVFSSTRWTIFKYSNTITTKMNNIHLRNIVT